MIEHPHPLKDKAAQLFHPVFSRLGEEAFVAVLEQLVTKTFAPGAAIVTEGEAGDSMFAIVEGRVDVVRQLEDGQQRKVASMGEGDFFGEMALLSGSQRLASVVAAEHTVVLELTRAQVEQLIQHHPQVGEGLRAFHQERLLANALRSNRLLSGLTPAQREALARDFRLHFATAGQTLLVQGQPGEAIFLLRGQCRVVYRHPNGHESNCLLLREGDVFGEIAALRGLPATATVIADGPCSVLQLDRAAAERHIRSEPGVRAALSRQNSERFQRTARLLAGPALNEAER